VAILKDWALRKVEIELIVPLGATALIHVGHVVQLNWSEQIEDFMFIGPSRMHAVLVPAIWRKSRVEKVEGLHTALHLETKKSAHELTLREVFARAKENPKLDDAMNQLRTWQKLRCDLIVLLNQGKTGIFFIGNVVELSPSIFTLVAPDNKLQLLVDLKHFTNMRLEITDRDTVLDLVTRDGECLMISDRTTNPEDIFQRFNALTAHIH
jgi:hypothetical protein